MTVLSKEQVLSAFKNRKSCRHYDAARKISAEDFQFILELGRLSPSSVGSEPWRFVVVQNPEIRQAIKLFSWGMADALDTASHLVVFLAKKNARFDSPFMLESLKRRGVTEPDAVEKSLARYQAFQADDIKILDDSRALFDWCCRQTYIALANMMTGAAMAGIDSCPVEGSTMPIWNAYCPGSSVCSMRQNGACPLPRHSATGFRKSSRKRAGPWKKPLFGHKAVPSENARIFRRHFLMLI